MSNVKIETIRSSSSGTIGRAVSHARGQRLVLDSSTHPQPDALTNSEAFLGAISSCGVTLIEAYAQGALASVDLVQARFISALQTPPGTVQILPIEPLHRLYLGRMIQTELHVEPLQDGQVHRRLFGQLA